MIVALVNSWLAAQPRLARACNMAGIANVARFAASLSSSLAPQSGRTTEAKTAGLTFLPRTIVALVNSRLAAQFAATVKAETAGLL